MEKDMEAVEGVEIMKAVGVLVEEVEVVAEVGEMAEIVEVNVEGLVEMEATVVKLNNI